MKLEFLIEIQKIFLDAKKEIEKRGMCYVLHTYMHRFVYIYLYIYIFIFDLDNIHTYNCNLMHHYMNFNEYIIFLE
jgi:hypothetical protein